MNKNICTHVHVDSIFLAFFSGNSSSSFIINTRQKHIPSSIFSIFSVTLAFKLIYVWYRGININRSGRFIVHLFVVMNGSECKHVIRSLLLFLVLLEL